jgi:hypothetical protein
MARHRHQKLIRFLNRVEAAVPAASWPMPSSTTEPVLRRRFAAAGGQPQVSQGARLARPLWGRWLNAVETFFAKLTRRRLQRGAFYSLVDLQAAINRYLQELDA